MHDSIQIEETAAVWLARRDGDEWSAEVQAALTEWLDASAAHRVAYLRLEAAWRQARRLKALASGAAFGEPPVWRSPPLSGVRQSLAPLETSMSVSNATEPPEQS
jgi:transmembrane sensor